MCWRCGKVGHKTQECRVKLQEVAEEPKTEGAEGGFVDEDALEVDKAWSLSCVDKCCGQMEVGGIKRKKIQGLEEEKEQGQANLQPGRRKKKDAGAGKGEGPPTGRAPRSGWPCQSPWTGCGCCHG